MGISGSGAQASPVRGGSSRLPASHSAYFSRGPIPIIALRLEIGLGSLRQETFAQLPSAEINPGFRQWGMLK
jgi:hypothetical protein